MDDSEQKIDQSEWSLDRDFTVRLRCLQLKRDIERLLNLQWMMEKCDEKEPPLLSMEVSSTAEFHDKLQQNNTDERAHPGDERKSKLRSYELVDWRKDIFFKDKKWDSEQ